MAEEAPAEPDLDAMTGLAASAMALLPEATDPVAAPRESTAAAPTTSLTSASTPAQATSSAAETYEQMEQLSQKMADAIGERLMREIDRGHWNVKLMLKPAHLGHIEVEMRLHAGALDASFTASQSQTRDILQDGLNRLKETLNQMGMDVANLDVRNGQNRQNGGNPTPGSARLTAPEASSQEAETPAPVTGSTPRPRTADGWDVMV
jgi:flagellar hook-length control protein FliK